MILHVSSIHLSNYQQVSEKLSHIEKINLKKTITNPKASFLLAKVSLSQKVTTNIQQSNKKN